MGNRNRGSNGLRTEPTNAAPMARQIDRSAVKRGPIHYDAKLAPMTPDCREGLWSRPNRSLKQRTSTERPPGRTTSQTAESL